MVRWSIGLGAAVLGGALVLGGCGGGADDEVLVFAAASLTDAFSDLAAEYEAANPEVDITLNLAGSSSLREQILEGAPASVFASADEATMAPVVDAGLTVGAAQVFATNRLQIAVPAGNPGAVTGPADLGDDRLLVGLCAESVPCGRLADEMFDRAGVRPAVDTREPDVRALLGKIEADELDVGVVYVTDVAGAAEVDGIEIPPDVNVEARYPIVRISESEEALGFVRFVVSEEGRSILARHGFGPP